MSANVTPQEPMRPSSLPEPSSSSTNLSLKQLQTLSKKLGEILGDENGLAVGEAVTQNEKGEILNEEGLPIVEISEPLHVDADSDVRAFEPSLSQEQSNALPLWALSSFEIQRRRAERDRILDLLEEEERIEREREERKEEEERQIALEKRREASTRDLASLKAARDLQKKMGKALIRNLAGMREKEEARTMEQLAQDAELEKERKSPKLRKKSVTFVLPEEGDGEPKERMKPLGSDAGFDWGDVAPAQLHTVKELEFRKSKSPSHSPMKSTVVERIPQTKSVDAPPERDSDDESDPQSPSASSDEGNSLPRDVGDVSDSDDDGFDLAEGEFDLDDAHHRREIALEYYEKRNKIGAQAAAAFASDVHSPDEDPWDQPEVPLDASLSSERPKPAISRFKADRLASTSLEGSILPVSQLHLLRSLRTGKVEDGNLVGNGESDSDEEDMKAIMELLKQGDVENTGPATTPLSSNSNITRQVIDSPSFQPPEGTPNISQPGVMSMVVEESSGARARYGHNKEKKVSRFAANRIL